MSLNIPNWVTAGKRGQHAPTLSKGKKRTRLPILLFHHVGPLPPGTEHPELTVSPDQFERQVQWLAAHGYVGIRPSDWLRYLRDGAVLPEKPVLITFDDGYSDLAAYAFPVLCRRGFSAGVFVVTGLVGKSSTWYGAQAITRRRLLTAAQLREWAVKGIEFGAHSRSHPDLRALSPRELAEEVSGSAQDLGQILGETVASFAYPYGFYNESVCRSVREVYKIAFSTEEGLNDTKTDLHLLRRTMVQPTDSSVDFVCRVRWGRSPLHNLRAWRVRRWRGQGWL